MLRAVLLTCAAAVTFAPAAYAVGTAVNGAPMDPQNVIADDIESEAYGALRKQSQRGGFKGPEIVIIDYRLPSSAKRLYIVNLQTGAVEPHYVAHGRGSDPDHTNIAYRFGDATSTGMSSVGAYRGLALYNSPEHGPALRVQGLDQSNSNAYDRLIVFHTAPYFDPANGRLGRSCGCFVVTTGDMNRVYNVIRDGGFLYAGPARLNDPSSTTARDCSPECGNICPPKTLIASNTRKNPPVAVASAEPPPPTALVQPQTPPPAPAPAPVLVAAAPPELAAPVVMAAIQPTPKPSLPAAPAPALAFAAPVPLPKPSLSEQPTEPSLVADATPIPLPKPALDVPPPAPVEIASDIPVPLAKPAALRLTEPVAVAAAESAPLSPHPKPDDLTLVASIVVPEVAPGEIPVPAPKPNTLQRVADAGPVP